MYHVKTYDLKAEGDRLVTSHFKVKEFKCHDGSRVVLISDDLCNLLEKIRAKLNEPIIINSAYRTVKYNQQVKGAENSCHMYGIAADIRAKRASPETVYKVAEEIMKGTGGLGKYPSFTHVDVRTKASRW